MTNCRQDVKMSGTQDMDRSTVQETPIVALGASAGGLRYVRYECFSLLRNSGIINGSEISNLQNWTVGLGASRKNAFGPEGWAAIPACFIPICAGACACMGHSYETPELLVAPKSATCKIGPLPWLGQKSAVGPVDRRPCVMTVSSPSVPARAPAWAIG